MSLIDTTEKIDSNDSMDDSESSSCSFSSVDEESSASFSSVEIEDLELAGENENERATNDAKSRRRPPKKKSSSSFLAFSSMPFLRRRKYSPRGPAGDISEGPVDRARGTGGSDFDGDDNTGSPTIHSNSQYCSEYEHQQGLEPPWYDAVLDGLADLGSWVLTKHKRLRRRKQNHAFGSRPIKNISYHRASTYLLLFSMFVWTWVQQSALEPPIQPKSTISSKRRPLGSVPFKRNRTESVEKVSKGCVYRPWQETSRSNCNIIHELDLRQHIRFVAQSSESQSGIPSDRYLSSGMWRDVFSVVLPLVASPRSSSTAKGWEQLVLKLMKSEHDVDSRNMNRHRREALAMEHLTSNPYIIDIYGHCANTVATEKAVQGLDELIQDAKPSKIQVIGNNIITKTLSAPNGTSAPKVTLDPLAIALQTAKALVAVHDADIIHADLQTKQFLIDERGNVKLNDFNRCRFLPRRREKEEELGTISNSTRNFTTGQSPTLQDGLKSLHNKPPSVNYSEFQICPIRIPSAPGVYRSPEEYTGSNLTHAMDVFSWANVLFELLALESPFKRIGFLNRKKAIGNGEKPVIPNRSLDQPLEPAWKESLAELMDRSYELDPSRRLTARALVLELERLVQGRHE